MAKQINKFAILGERCTGTNCLEEAMLKNFKIEYTAEYGNKHFYCYNDYKKRESNDTLFIGIVRNPIYWLNSFSKELHHVSSVNKKSLQNFLFNEFYSVEKIKEDENIFYGNKLLLNNKLSHSKEVVNPRDLNYLNGNKYKNIFELRKVKHHFLMKIMPYKVNNYILINYEDILYNFETTMKIIKDKFNLVQKLPSFEKVTKYKKSNTYNFVKQRDITFSVETIKLIWQHLDMQQENLLGYYPFNNNYFFVEKYKSEKKNENMDENINENIDENMYENIDENMDENIADFIYKKKQPMNSNIYEKMNDYIYKKIDNKIINNKNNNDVNKLNMIDENLEDEINRVIYEFHNKNNEKNNDITIHESDDYINNETTENNENVENSIIIKQSKINAIKMFKKNKD